MAQIKIRGQEAIEILDREAKEIKNIFTDNAIPKDHIISARGMAFRKSDIVFVKTDEMFKEAQKEFFDDSVLHFLQSEMEPYRDSRGFISCGSIHAYLQDKEIIKADVKITPEMANLPNWDITNPILYHQFQREFNALGKRDGKRQYAEKKELEELDNMWK